MKLLLDTHALLWMLSDAPELSSVAGAAISSVRNEKLLSIASLWEVTIKVGSGKLSLAQPLAVFLDRIENDGRIRVLPIQSAHLLKIVTWPHHHRDPFDRLIVAQALNENCTLLSSDRMLDAYGVARLW